MRTSTLLSSISVVLFCGTALAQGSEPTAPAEPTASAELAAAEAPPDAQQSPGTVTETESVQASPDVQAQVGVGTEKETTKAEPSTTPGSAVAPPPPAKEEPVDYGHFFQVGARAGISIPYKIMARFENSPPCPAGDTDDEDEERKVCAIASSPTLDLALSFAPLDIFEPYVWFRMGLSDETETNTAALRVFGAGARIYTMSDSMVKMFFEPAIGIETEGAIDPTLSPDAKYDTDFFVHLNFGGQLDFTRYAGVYLALGPNVSFVRAITTTLEANAGLQIRLP